VFHFGNTLADRHANFDRKQPYGDGTPVDPPNRPVAVGSFTANAFGLYDMHGNVREWVADGYEDRFEAAAVKDPFVPTAGRRAVMRGGSWFDAGSDCRSAARKDADPDTGYPYTGFRIAVSFESGK